MLDRDAIDRIVSAAGGPPTGVNYLPAWEGELASKLEWSAIWYRINNKLGAGTSAKRALVVRTIGTAQRLRSQVDKLGVGNSELSDQLEQLVSGLEAFLAEPSDQSRQLKTFLRWDDCSAFEWLAARKLADIYRELFKQEPGISRDAYNNGRPGGPYLRFVDQTLIELGITNGDKPYSAEAIASAWAKAQSGRSRSAKHIGQVQTN